MRRRKFSLKSELEKYCHVLERETWKMGNEKRITRRSKTERAINSLNFFFLNFLSLSRNQKLTTIENVTRYAVLFILIKNISVRESERKAHSNLQRDG